MNISKFIGGSGDIILNRLYVLIICSLFLFGGNMDLNDIKDKAENFYGGEITTEYKEF